jgi:hypothetical protein
MKIHPRRAFTLFQILVAILIIAILFGVVYIRTQATNKPPQVVLKPEPKMTPSSIVVQTTGNEQVRLTSGDIRKIGENPCLVIIYRKEGESTDIIKVWFTNSKEEPIPFTPESFQESVRGKAITELDPASSDYKQLRARLEKTPGVKSTP